MNIRIVIILVCLLLAGSPAAWADQINEILSKIEQVASLGGKTDRALNDSVADDIEKSPAEVSEALVDKLDGKDLTEHQLAVYVWALGLTKDQAAIKTIKKVYKQSKSELVRGNCLRALAAIGGKQAGKFLLSAFDAEADRDKRSDILNWLGQMQFEEALPKTEEVLRLDPKESYWESIFVFGKMGDRAVPFLLEKIKDKDRNIRVNAINVLGQWLVPPEAAEPLLNHYWQEDDVEVRRMILSSLERTIADLTQMKTVFEQVVVKEKDQGLVKFARETLANMTHMKTDAVAFAEKKRLSPESFQREYAQLFKTAGKKGSYEVIATSSAANDEPKLKALRERILRRDSDEAFYDYQKVNRTIILNRMIKKTVD